MQTLTKKEQKALKSITIPSKNNPQLPEFPPQNPKFPATNTYKIHIEGFENVWLKDESTNRTGTHKDRMAWEIIVTYKKLLLEKKRQNIRKLPAPSIISSGSAANAIQSLLQEYGLPNLKVLMDYRTKPKIKSHLENINCEIYETDLSKKSLQPNEILELTNNKNGIDITSDLSLEPNTRFYDWLSYEILNNSPDYCFIPYGSGHLYENILNIITKEITNSPTNHDPRFQGDLTRIKNCNFIGATTNSPSSKADKLYSPHLPFTQLDNQILKSLIDKKHCGPKSSIRIIQEKFLDKALKICSDQKIECEPSGIAGLALLLQIQNEVPKTKKILIVNTGKNKLTI